MTQVWHRLQFRIPLVLGISFLLILATVTAVMSTLGRRLLEEQAYKEIVLSAENIVAELGNRIALAESLAVALANLGETLPADEAMTRRMVRHLLDYEGTESFVAGGGLWPAPYRYDANLERRSFFWGRDQQGQLRFYDNYNNPEGPGYHHEEWYVPAKHLPEGRAFWSRSYMDPYSYQPMVTVTVPMYRDGQFYGVSTVDLKLEGLRGLLETATRAFDGYAFALDRNGKFLSFPDEDLTKIYDVDAQGQRTEEFIDAPSLAQKLPAFTPVADAIARSIERSIEHASELPTFNTLLAQDIERDSYQVGPVESQVIAAMLALRRSEAAPKRLEPMQLFVEHDPILGESAFTALFDMPNTGWKVVTAMPYSKAIQGAELVYQNIVTAIIVVTLISVLLLLLFVRRILVHPIADLSSQLRAMTVGEDPEKTLLRTGDQGELGELVEHFNQRTEHLLRARDELRDAHARLEQRVRERTRALEDEMDKRREQEILRETARARADRQHAAIVSLSLREDFLNEDIHTSARHFTEIAAEAIDAERVSIWLFDESGQHMEPVDIYVRTTDTHERGPRLTVSEYPSYFSALEQDRSIAVTDIFDDPRTAEMHVYARTLDVRSLLDSPFRIGGGLRGVVCIEHVGTPREWHGDEIRFSGELADQFVHVLSNVERIRSDEQIRQLAFYDPLTSLANRRLLDETIRHALQVARRHSTIGSLIYLDLDNFKTLNDSLGHAVGDELLSQVAERLKQTLRGEDVAARLGGDEFVVLLPAESQDREEAIRQALAVANKINQVINQPYRLRRYKHIITTSIGITLYPDQRDDTVDLLKQADAAMYRAKAEGRNRIAFYDPSMQEAAQRRLLLENDLRQSIHNGQFELYFQPQINRDGRTVGAEALVRWNHPVRGVIEPLEFIDVAEETGLILELGLWILTDACRFISQTDLDHVAVNISTLQFRHPDFIDQVIDILARTGAPPDRLMIEITERIVIGDVDDAVRRMNALKARGIRFAIDDFGTGYSSLAYLKRLPLDQLKINNDFIRDIDTDASNGLLVETIISMAQHLGLEVVAEGVETQAECEFLHAHGSNLIQGFYYSQAVPEQDLRGYISKTRAPQALAGRSQA